MDFKFTILLLSLLGDSYVALSPQEIKALKELKRAWNVSGWSGEPNCTTWNQHITCNKQLNIVILDVGFAKPNLLSGSIPEAICLLPFLEQLKLYGNRLSGVIPSCLGNLTHLKYLDFSGNCLGGEIPESLGNLVNMEYFDLSVNCHNDFSFPHRDLCNKSVLSNGLTGRIPETLGTMTKVTYFYLSGNKLNGSIPASIGNLANAMYIYINANNITGSIPHTIGKLQKLQDLQLNKNQISGHIPSEIGNCSSLRIIQINHNRLTGEIPDTIGNLAQLQALELLSNRIQGQIPEFKTTPVLDLNLFDLRDNDLAGTLPDSFRDAPLRYLFVNNNKKMRGRNNALPAYIKPDYNSRSVIDLEKQFECPGYLILSRTFKVTLPLIQMDPDYYNYTLCSCRSGFYGNPPEKCRLCLQNGDCDSKVTGTMSFSNGFYPIRDSSDNEVREILPCSWVNVTFSACNPNSNCFFGRHGLEAISGNCSLCADGYEGRLCSKCSCKHANSCYFLSHQQCVPCANFSSAELAFYLVGFIIFLVLFAIFDRAPLIRLLLTIVLVSFALSLNDGSWLYFNTLLFFIVFILVTGKTASSGVTKTLIFYFQTAASLMPTVMPRSVHLILQNLSSTLNLTNLKFLGMVCLFPEFLGESKHAISNGFVFALCAPVFVFVVVVAFLALKRVTSCCFKHRTTQASFKHQVAFIMIFIAYFSFFNASKLVISIFSCKSDSTGYSYMNEYPTMRCYGDKWNRMAMAAAVGGVILVLVPLIVFTMLLHRHRNNFDDPIVASWLGYLYVSYKPLEDAEQTLVRSRVWVYSEIFVMAYRLILAACLAILDQNNPLKPICIMLVLMATVPFFLSFKPYSNSADNYIAFVTILSLISTLFMSMQVKLISAGARLDIGHSTILWSILALVNGLTVLMFFIIIIRRGRHDLYENGKKLKRAIVNVFIYIRHVIHGILRRNPEENLVQE